MSRRASPRRESGNILARGVCRRSFPHCTQSAQTVAHLAGAQTAADGSLRPSSTSSLPLVQSAARAQRAQLLVHQLNTLLVVLGCRRVCGAVRRVMR